MAKTPILPPEPDTADDVEPDADGQSDPTDRAVDLVGNVDDVRERLLAGITLAADAVAAEAGDANGDVDIATRWTNIAGMLVQTLDLFEQNAGRRGEGDDVAGNASDG